MPSDIREYKKKEVEKTNQTFSLLKVLKVFCRDIICVKTIYKSVAMETYKKPS